MVMLPEQEMSSSPLSEVTAKSRVTEPILIWEAASFLRKDLLLFWYILDYLLYFRQLETPVIIPRSCSHRKEVRMSMLWGKNHSA